MNVLERPAVNIGVSHEPLAAEEANPVVVANENQPLFEQPYGPRRHTLSPWMRLHRPMIRNVDVC